MRSRLTSCLCFVWLASILPGARAPAQDPGYINFNFDNVEIGLVIKTVGELTGRRFVMDETVTGKISVVTPPQTAKEDVYPLFLRSLESRGFSVIARDQIHHIVKLPARAVPGAPLIGADQPIVEDGISTKIFAVENIGVSEIRKILEPLVSGGNTGALAAIAGTNHLIVTDTGDALRRIQKIISELDKPGGAKQMEVVPLNHAQPSQITQSVLLALKGTTNSAQLFTQHAKRLAAGDGHLPFGATVIPVDHAGALIIAGTSIQIAEIKRVIELLDVEQTAGQGRLQHIFLKYLSAEEISKSLSALLAKSQAKEYFSHIAIEPSLANNALLVDASPANFMIVKQLVTDLDIPPEQVMVEVLLAEVSVGKRLDLGVEWATIEIPQNGKTTFIGRQRLEEADAIRELVTGGVFPQGVTLALAKGTFKNADGVDVPAIPALVKALQQNRDVKILSNVPLWAQNNKEASVSVVENIPVLSSTIEGGAGTSRDVIQNIERLDVGITLTVTPHVNPDKEIQLELNPSIEAVVDEGPAGQFSPTIAKREVSTTVTIPDGATIMISGLIREDIIKGESKVPLLGDIPVLGNFFKTKSNQRQKTNLLIFVTPRIVKNMADAEDISRAFEKKTELDTKSIKVLPPIPLNK